MENIDDIYGCEYAQVEGGRKFSNVGSLTNPIINNSL
jgi:hypothetical protein